MKHSIVIMLLGILICIVLLFHETSNLYECIAELHRTDDTLHIEINESKAECLHALDVHEDMCDAQIKGITGGW